MRKVIGGKSYGNRCVWCGGVSPKKASGWTQVCMCVEESERERDVRILWEWERNGWLQRQVKMIGTGRVNCIVHERLFGLEGKKGENIKEKAARVGVGIALYTYMTKVRWSLRKAFFPLSYTHTSPYTKMMAMMMTRSRGQGKTGRGTIDLLLWWSLHIYSNVCKKCRI